MQPVNAQDSPVRVLVVEDDKFFRVLIRDILETAGMEVSEVGNAEDAVAVITTSNADVMILDYLLGDQTALEVWEFALRANVALAQKTILLTGALDGPQ